MPPAEDPVSLSDLQGASDSSIFMEQALGSIVTKGLREVSENRLKHPNMSVKETMLKLFALYLKADNPANTDYMREKYSNKMKQFVTNCEMAEELHALAEEKKSKGSEAWPEFKEKYYF
jgi:adenylate/nucleoside-diphosphate kinase